MRNSVSMGRLGAEGLAIVASILIAFGIDASWDTRQQRLEVRGILEALQAEFEGHRSDLATQLLRSDSIVVGLQPILDDQGAPLSLTDQEIAAAAFAAQAMFDWDVSGGWNGVVSGGKLALIEDLELRGALTSWPGIVDDVLDNQQLMQTFGLQIIVPAMAEANMPVRNSGLSADDLATYRRVLADPELRALLATKSRFYINSIEDIRRAQSTANLVLELLEAPLAR